MKAQTFEKLEAFGVDDFTNKALANWFTAEEYERFANFYESELKGE